MKTMTTMKTRGHGPRGALASWLALAALTTLAACEGILGIPSDPVCTGCDDAVTVGGSVLRVDRVAEAPREEVQVRVTSVASNEAPKTTSDAAGAYSLPALGLNTSLDLELSFPQLNPTIDPGSSRLSTRYFAGNVLTDRDLDLPVVEFRWLAQVAFDCGLFDSLEEATFEPRPNPQVPQTVNAYYIQRSTVIVDVRQANGTPATLNREDIVVQLGGFRNTHAGPGDLDPNPAFICFLEPQGDVYAGRDASSTTSGRFVMFRARDDIGTGTGLARVEIPGFPVGLVNLRGSSGVAFVRIREGEGGAPLPSQPRTFVEDVYPLFQREGCTSCHRPGGIGFNEAPVRDGFRADWSGTPEQVFANLTQPSMVGCELDGAAAVPARVCRARPERSLLYTKIRAVPNQTNHKGITFFEDDAAGGSVLRIVLDWLENDAVFQ